MFTKGIHGRMLPRNFYVGKEGVPQGIEESLVVTVWEKI